MFNIRMLSILLVGGARSQLCFAFSLEITGVGEQLATMAAVWYAQLV